MSFKKLITKIKISTLPHDILRSKLTNITIIDARFCTTCQSMVFFTMVGNIFSNKKDQNEMGKPCRGIGVKLTFKAKCSHIWANACNLCKYKKPNLPKLVANVHHFFVWVCGTKKMNNCIIRRTYPFLPQLP